MDRWRKIMLFQKVYIFLPRADTATLYLFAFLYTFSCQLSHVLLGSIRWDGVSEECPPHLYQMQTQCKAHTYKCCY